MLQQGNDGQQDNKLQQSQLAAKNVFLIRKEAEPSFLAKIGGVCTIDTLYSSSHHSAIFERGARQGPSGVRNRNRPAA